MYIYILCGRTGDLAEIGRYSTSHDGPLDVRDVGVAAVAAVTAVTLSVPVGKLLTGLTSSMAARCATLSGPRGYSRIEKGWKDWKGGLANTTVTTVATCDLYSLSCLSKVATLWSCNPVNDCCGDRFWQTSRHKLGVVRGENNQSVNLNVWGSNPTSMKDLAPTKSIKKPFQVVAGFLNASELRPSTVEIYI